MFFMSGDSTKEWERYLLAGSSGWAILNEPPPISPLPAVVIPVTRSAAGGHDVMQLEPMQNCGAVTLVATLSAPGAVNIATIVPLHRPSAAVVPAHAVRKLYDPLVAVAESRRNIVPVSALDLFRIASPVCDPVLSVIVTLLFGAGE